MHAPRPLRFGALIATLGLLTAGSAGRAAAAGTSNQSFTAQADRYLTSLAVQHRFEGTVLFAHAGTILFEKSYGLQDLWNNVPATLQTQYPLASVTKQFTATLILMLQDEGKLSVQDHVCPYLASCPATSAWQGVTLQMLLTHTAGLSHDCGITQQTVSSLENIALACQQSPFKYQPGTHYSYSNAGYAILGAVVERVSGEAYPTFLSHRILQPVRMSSSGMEVSGVPARLAVPSMAWDRAAPRKPRPPMAYAGLYSTVGDLFRWDEALNHHQLLSPAAYQEMFMPYPNTGAGCCHYGFGWVIQNQQGHSLIWHNGGSAGVRTYNGRYPAEQVDVVVLSNLARADSTGIGRTLGLQLVESLDRSASHA
jgi:D-alanyl-D-alanine carboxypeptidase